MAERRYLDFELSIEEVDAGSFRARVLDSPAGEARSTFAFPLSTLEVENFVLRLGRGGQSVRRRLESSEREAARTFGAKLFDAVFANDVATCLRRSIDEAERTGHGLRIRLRLSDAPSLVGIPWEYLYSTSQDRFLVLSSWTPLVRYLDLPRRVMPLRVAPPVRVLVMISSPTDYPSLDTDAEWRRLHDGLADLIDAGRVQIDRLDDASLRALQRALLQKDYHALHFIGHGGFDEPSGDGVLMLEGEGGRARLVPGRDLGTILHDHRSLRLAILNACEGGRTSASDPFSGSAQSLVRAGIPAVVAMQFEISDRAAVTFAHAFYGAIAVGLPVDAAVTEARKAVFGQGDDAEWGTPVVYMRSPDGHIFDIPDAASAPVEAEPPGVTASAAVVESADEAVATPVASAAVPGPALEPIEPETIVSTGVPEAVEVTPAEGLPAAVPGAALPPEREPETARMPPGAGTTAPTDPGQPTSTPRPPPSPKDSGAVMETGTPSTRPAPQRQRSGSPPRRRPPAPDTGERERVRPPVPDERPWIRRPGTRVAAVGIGLAFLAGAIAAIAMMWNSAPGTTTAGSDDDSGLTTPTAEMALEEPASNALLGPVVTAQPLSGFRADGDLREWIGFETHVTTPFQVFTSPQANWDGTDDVESKWWLGYDEDNLYIAVSVTDDIHNQPSTGNQIYRGDAVDIHIGLDVGGSDRPDDDDYQIILSPGDFAGSPPTHIVFQGDGTQFARDRMSADIVVAARQTETGYRLEASIPWVEFGLNGPPPAPGEGVPVLLLLSVFDNDGEVEANTGRVAQTVIKSHVDGGFQRPLEWGRLVVAE